MTHSPNLGRIPLAVIGGGPVGIAALWYAALEGLPAVGLEAGPAPLTNIRSYMDGLVVISPAHHYEIPGLPLDCRDPDELTREEILHYYTRVIQYGQLDVRCGMRCTGLRPDAGHVAVDVVTSEGPGHWIANNVLVTTWYEPRRLATTHDAPRTIEVLHGIRHPSQVAGKRCVVVGGGASALEQATAIMLSGQSLTVLARGELGSWLDEHVSDLLEATNSRVIDGVSDVRAVAGGIGFRRRAEPGPLRIECDVVVACIGQELSPAVARMLEAAGVLTGEVLDRLREAPTTDQLARRRAAPDIAGILEIALETRPDLWHELVTGINGIRLVGGALHLGGPHSGVMISIHTAQIAIDAVLGRRPPKLLTRPLAKGLLDLESFPWTSRIRHDVIAPLRPLAVRSWTRTARLPVTEQASGWLADRPSDPCKYLLGPLRTNTVAHDLLRVANGRSSVSEIAEHNGVDYDRLVEYFNTLWRCNALSWLPPSNGLADVRRSAVPAQTPAWSRNHTGTSAPQASKVAER